VREHTWPGVTGVRALKPEYAIHARLGLAGSAAITNRVIDQSQYTVLVTAVIGSAVVPTLGTDVVSAGVQGGWVGS
jgi:hypothetical protein